MKWKHRVPRESVDISRLSENPHPYETKLFSVNGLWQGDGTTRYSHDPATAEDLRKLLIDREAGSWP